MCLLYHYTETTSRSLKAPTLLLNGYVLQQVFDYKYLGITISADLSWHNHINTICNKTRKLIGLLHRRFRQFFSNNTIKVVYILCETTSWIRFLCVEPISEVGNQQSRKSPEIRYESLFEEMEFEKWRIAHLDQASFSAAEAPCCCALPPVQNTSQSDWLPKQSNN